LPCYSEGSEESKHMKKLLTLILMLVFLTQATGAHRICPGFNPLIIRCKPLTNFSLRPQSTASQGSVKIGYVENFYDHFEYVKTINPRGLVLAYRYKGKKLYPAPFKNMQFEPGKIYVLRIPGDDSVFNALGYEGTENIRAREAEALAVLNPENSNPHLPKLYGLVEPSNDREEITLASGYGPGALVEYIEGVELSKYVNTISAGERQDQLFIDLALMLFEAYKSTFADKGFVSGDLDPYGILLECDGIKVKRLVFADNDTVTMIYDTSDLAVFQKKAGKDLYISRDRALRLENYNEIPVDQLCQPRDDIYSLCVMMLQCLPSVNASAEMGKLVEILKKYSKLSDTDNGCSLEELIAEVKGLALQNPAENNTGIRSSSAGYAQDNGMQDLTMLAVPYESGNSGALDGLIADLRVPDIPHVFIPTPSGTGYSLEPNYIIQFFKENHIKEVILATA
jgi:hypothetical protein